jgi:hypothetical protein
MDWHVRSSANGATNWSAESVMTQAMPYRNYQTASGFFHPYGDYTETVTTRPEISTASGRGRVESRHGDVYFAKF